MRNRVVLFEKEFVKKMMSVHFCFAIVSLIQYTTDYRQYNNHLKWYHTLQVKFDLLVLFSYFFGSVFEYIHCNKYQNFNKFQPTDSEL